MANIYNPQKEEEILTPFSPILGYKKMSDAFIEKCNKAIDDEMEDWSGNLVGKGKEELKWNDDLNKAWTDEMGQFLMRYQSHAELYTSMGTRNITPDVLDYRLEIASSWFVRQYEHEYNPIHVHLGSMLSCVGYLKLPEGIE